MSPNYGQRNSLPPEMPRADLRVVPKEEDGLVCGIDFRNQRSARTGGHEQLKTAGEVSVVIPCLNEADTIGICVEKARRTMEAEGIQGEIIVADNGSTDDSQKIALEEGARIIHVSDKGYGHALMAGIAAATGQYVIMGDADDSYDFQELPKFVRELRKGYDVVQGCRLPSGNGTISPGAMPFLHRWIGNPILSWMVRLMFQAQIHDVYCGFRGFSKDYYEKLEQRCTGMEFATEMIIKSSLAKAKVAEVPITLHPDGRRQHGPHLRTFRDGWRTLRLFMLCSPRWLYLLPGIWLNVLGLTGFALAMPGFAVWGARLDAHTLLISTLFLLMGYQAMLFAVLTKVFAIREKLLPPDKRVDQFFNVFTLERGLLLGGGGFVLGVLLLCLTVGLWWQSGFGFLNYAQTMRLLIPGITLAALGFQTVLSSFFISILGMSHK